MAAEIHLEIAGGMIIVILGAVAILLVLIGLFKRDSLLRSVGLVLLGAMVFATPMAFYLDKASSSWGPFIPTVTDLIILGVSTFLGGVLCTLGALTYKKGGFTPNAR